MLNDADERPIGYRPIMSERHVLDFQAGNPWSARASDVFSRACTAAWADAAHPASEGRRSAVWRDATRATVAALTGFAHVRFVPDRRAAYEALALAGIRPSAAPATHRRHLLRRGPTPLPVDEHGSSAVPSEHVGWLALQAANDETGVIDAIVNPERVVLDADMTLGRSPVPTDVPVVVADARCWGSPIDLAMVLSHEPIPIFEAVQVPAMAVAVDALTLAFEAMPERALAESVAMQALESRLVRNLPDVQFHGRDRVGHVRSFSVLHLDAETLMRALDAAGYVVGSGSACARDGSPSDVLAAMGRVTHGNVRLALPVGFDLDVLETFAQDLIAIVQRLRREAGVEDL